MTVHRTPSLLAALVLSVGWAASLSAQETRFEMDSARSRVEYTLGAVLHTVHGTFKVKEGAIRFDPATGKAAGAVVVDATSGESGNTGRDKRMHSDILQSRSYPEITFAPDRIEGPIASEGESAVQVHGLFTIHGQPHEITVPAQVRVTGGEAEAAIRFVVPYVKWGMKNPSTLFLRVSDKVQIELHAVGRLKLAAAKLTS